MANRFVVDPKLLVAPLLTSLGDGCIDSYVHSSGEQGIRYEIRFLGNQCPAFGDRIELSLVGPFDPVDEVSVRAALICTIAAIRDDYGILVGDYSYSKMVGSHKAFMTVQSRLTMVVCEFRKAKNAALSFLRSLNEFMVGARGVPVLLSFLGNKSSVLAAAGREMMVKVKQSNQAVEDMFKMENIANDPVSFFKAIGTEIDMSEEESYFLVQEVYKQVMVEQFCKPPPIYASRKGNARVFQASVELPGLGTVVGDERGEEFSSIVACMIKALKVVETTSGKEVQDLCFGMWQAMRDSIESFNVKCQFAVVECRKICAATLDCMEFLQGQFSDVQSSGSVGSGIPIIASALGDVLHRFDARKKCVEQATADLEANLRDGDDFP